MSTSFEGIRVLDFTNNLAGPTCSAMLADFGADVIKLEKPSGDDSRRYAPRLGGRSVTELWTNRGKRSVTVDMNDEDGQAFIGKLIAEADVIVEAFRPGIMKKFGFDYETLHALYPRLIYCSISAFGQTGPMSQEGGYDTLIQAMCGMMDMTGEPDGAPTKMGFPVVDYCTAHVAFGAVATALYVREKTGKGQLIDAALYSTAISMNHFLEQTSVGVPVSRNGNISKVVAPVGNYSGKCGTLCISCNNDKLFFRCAKAMGREDLLENPEFSTNVARGRNTLEVKAIMEEWIDSFEDISMPERILHDAGVPCAKVNNNAGAIELAERAGHGSVAPLRLGEELGWGTLLTRGITFKLSETPGVLSEASHQLGADTLDVLIEAGYDPEVAQAMAQKWSSK